MGITDFINRSPTPYHAVESAITILKANNFQKLNESEKWNLKPSGKYFVTRNTSSIIAFHLPEKWEPKSPTLVVGAHTDSPTLRIKPKSKILSNGYVQLGVEIYGGGLWPTWFDRDLSVAGKVYFHENGQVKHKLVKINKPLLRIPTLAIHLHREQSTKLEFNKERHLKPILDLQDPSENKKTLVDLIASELNIKNEDIADFELMLFDTQDSVIGGLNDEFIFSGRLDNLNSCYCALNALIQSPGTDSVCKVVSLFDHEEVGSVSAQGAASNFLHSVLSRVNGDSLFESISRSLLVSADMAHAVHPNYSEKYEDNHQPHINEGPVIKVNANQRYATNSYGTVVLVEAAKVANVPLQKFVVRNDSTCGSTIGPMLASQLGITTIDIGNPQLSMHSIREMCGTRDVDFSIQLFKALFDYYYKIEATVQKD